MKQKVFSIIPIIAHSVVICLTSVFSSCKQESDDPAVGNDSSAILTIRINPGDAMNPAYRTPSTRTGEEYEPDKWPANDKEKMHTVRIMIINSDGIVEHNSLWDLTISPDIVAMGQDYTVSANDTKHIIIIANEATATITLPEGKRHRHPIISNTTSLLWVRLSTFQNLNQSLMPPPTTTPGKIMTAAFTDHWR